MALDKFNWQNGSQVEPAKVEVEGVSYDVVDAQYEGETPLSAANLNLMQDTLLSNVVDNLDDDTKIPSCKAVKDIYSTDEVKTNKVWKDGSTIKPIYRKVYEGTIPANSSTYKVTNSSDIDDVTNSLLKIYSSNSYTSTEWIGYLSSNVYSGFQINNVGEILLYLKSQSSALNYRLILEYTKTTD